MANKKSASGSGRPTAKNTSARKTATRRSPRLVVDPMMVSPRQAKQNDRRLTDTAIDNGVDFDSDDDFFINDRALYDIDDLYDENGALILDEADEVLRNEERRERNRGYVRADVSRKNNSKPANKNNSKVSEDDFDVTEEELEAELAKRRKGANRPSGKAEKKAAKRRKKAERKARRKVPVWTKVLIGFLSLIIIVIGVGAYYFFNIYGAAAGVLEGNPMDAFFNKKPLAKDEYGRTNFLIFGTAEDDEGHGGAMLTDSILIVSLDQERKIASTFSVPRDLWVNYTVTGEKQLWCPVGYKGKINATYYCKQNDADGDNDAAARYFAKKITEVTDIQLQYYVAVDFRVLRDVVNTLGGIDVDVHATDDRGIYDICMHGLKLDKGMNYNLNGDQVLDLARARNAKGGYGLANSNFDREINQQRIINGIKDKALNVGILADVNKVKQILESFGENVKTNLTWAEMGTGIDVLTGLNGDIESIDTRSLYGTGNIGSQSVVIPRGANVDSEQTLYNYNRIHLYLRDELDKATAEFDKAKEAEEETEE